MLKLLILFSALCCLINARTYVVALNGKNDEGCGSKDKPCLSIDHVLRSFNDTTDKNLIINVTNGIYKGSNTQVIIGKGGIMKDGCTPVITIDGSKEVAIDFEKIHPGWLINDYPNDVNLNGIIFKRMFQLGLQLKGSQKVTYKIMGCDFNENYYNESIPAHPYSQCLDVEVGAQTNVLIGDSSFLDTKGDFQFGYGALLIKSGQVTVEGCVFKNNTFRNGPLTIINTDDHLESLTVKVVNSAFFFNRGLESASIYSRSIRKTNMVYLSGLTIANNNGSVGVIELSNGPQILQNTKIHNNFMQHALVVKGIKGEESKKIQLHGITITENVGVGKVGVGYYCTNSMVELKNFVVKDNIFEGKVTPEYQSFCKDCTGCEGRDWNVYLVVVVPVIAGAVLLFLLGGLIYYFKFYQKSGYTEINSRE